MWSPWGRSPPPSPTLRGASPRFTFPCSSFKDVPRLLYSDDDPTSPRNTTTTSSSLQLTRPEPENPNPTRPRPSRNKPVLHRVRAASSLIRNWPGPTRPTPTTPRITTPGADTRIIVYHTSLRAVRPTFEACRSVQLIFGGFRVAVDERDVVMDASLLEELGRVLKRVTLPAVFIGGWYVGGAEEVRQMNEAGELRRLVEVLPKAEPRACDACGGYRFVVCGECNGSRKVYGDDKVGVRACAVCNENGLIKCRACFSTVVAR